MQMSYVKEKSFVFGTEKKKKSKLENEDKIEMRT